MPGVSFYLTPARLRRLDEYSYSAVDKSPLSNYVMRHWWVYSASFAPPWLAPNAITLLGFAAILINFATVWIFCPDLVGPAHPLVYASCAFGLFFYQTMDNIDGKQARRTGTSSPLGELFDHGLDTLNCPIGGLIQAAAMGLGQSKYAVLCILVPCWSMFVSTWEEYHTGTLYLGFVNGPVEGVLIAVGILTVSAVKGPGWWASPVHEVLGNLPLIPSSFQLLDLVMLFLASAFLVAHLPLCLLNVHSTLSPPRSRRALTSPRPVPRRNPSMTTRQAFAQLLPIVAFSVLTVTWVLSPKSRVLKDGYLEEFALVVCFLFGQLSSKIILAQLTRGPFPFSWSLLLPLAVPAILVNTPYIGLPWLLPPSLEPLYLHLALFVSLATYSHAVHEIISAFCSYLGIECLTIPFPNKAVEGWQPLPASSSSSSAPSTRLGARNGRIGSGRSAHAHATRPEDDERNEGAELEYEMDRFASSSASSSPRGGGGRSPESSRGILGGVPGFKGFLGVVGGEGRKRSNTSERERGTLVRGGGGLFDVDEGQSEGGADARRVARVANGPSSTASKPSSSSLSSENATRSPGKKPQLR
ncbi:hypothetical protein JCM10212_006595 [Sporobolomyces blumeae]